MFSPNRSWKKVSFPFHFDELFCLYWKQSLLKCPGFPQKLHLAVEFLPGPWLLLNLNTLLEPYPGTDVGLLSSSKAAGMWLAVLRVPALSFPIALICWTSSASKPLPPVEFKNWIASWIGYCNKKQLLLIVFIYVSRKTRDCTIFRLSNNFFPIGINYQNRKNCH